MIRALIGNIFESKAQTLVNTVNCVGIMGKGLALEFKKRFPEMYEDYVIPIRVQRDKSLTRYNKVRLPRWNLYHGTQIGMTRCKAKGVQLGEPYLYPRLLSPWILNFPTKGHWRSVSHLSDIVAGLEYLEKHYREWEITSLAVPALGCQNGQLEWHIVGPLLHRHLSRLDIPVELYAPHGTPQEEIEISFLTQSPIVSSTDRSQEERGKINPAYIGLVEIIARIEHEPYHWPVGRTIFQKIAYFATELGLPTGLNFRRESYGPFSPNVPSLVTRLVNNGLIREVQLGQMFALKLGPKYKDIAQAFETELAPWEPIINRIVDLFLRMRTLQAEIAATVHFTAQALHRESENIVTEKAIFEGVKHWKQRRQPPLQDEEIAHTNSRSERQISNEVQQGETAQMEFVPRNANRYQTIRNLNLLGWIDAQPSPDLPLAEEETLLDI